MATVNINKKQLKTKSKDRSNKKIGEGFLNTFEIPVGGTPVVTQVTSRLFRVVQQHAEGIQADTADWQAVISRSDSNTVNTYTLLTNQYNFDMQIYPQSGRGATLYRNMRGHMGLTLSGSSGITGSITAANIYLPISRSHDNGPGYIYGGGLGIFSAGTGSLADATSEYSLYVSNSKTIYSDFQTPSVNTVFTYSLNSTAIEVLNENNNFGGTADDINFAIIWDDDFNGTAPTDAHSYDFVITGSETSDPNVITPNPSGLPGFSFLPPRIELTFTPD